MDEPTNTPGSSNAVTPGHTAALYHNELQKRKLSIEEAARYGLFFVDRTRVRDLVGGRSQDAIALPYFDLRGEPIPDFVRVRYLGVVPERYNKYAQRKGSGTHYYFPRGFDWQAIASNPNVKLIITEGEFKALAIARALVAEGFSGQFAVCAVAGVSCALAKGQARLHHDLDPFKWRYNAGGTWVPREVYICYDYDGANQGATAGEPRPEVANAEAQLVVMLKAAGATVKLCRVGRYCKNPNEKYAIDDHLIEGRLADVLMNAEEPQQASVAGSKHRLYEFAAQYALLGAKFLELGTGREYTDSEMRTVAGHLSYEDVGARGGRTLHYLHQDYARWTKRSVLKGRIMDPRYMGQRITPEGFYNSCPDFPFTPVAGDLTPWLAFTAYFFKDNPPLEEHFHRWVAHIIQYPWIKQHSCWQFLSSLNGVGKSYLGEVLVKMLGPLGVEVGPNEVFSDHNSFLDGKLLILANEPSSDDERHTQKLKALVTNATLQIHEKYMVAYHITNYTNFIITSNRPYVTMMDDSSRREWLYTPRSHDANHVKELVNACKEWVKQTCYGPLMHYYCTFDLEGYDPGEPPLKTRDLERAISLSKTTFNAFATRIVELLLQESGDAPVLASLPALRQLYYIKEGARLPLGQQLRRALAQHPLAEECTSKGELYYFVRRDAALFWSDLDAQQKEEVIKRQQTSPSLQVAHAKEQMDNIGANMLSSFDNGRAASLIQSISHKL